MSIETIDTSFADDSAIMESGMFQDEPLNGTDARRRLEDKIEELKLRRELQEFDFDL